MAIVPLPLPPSADARALLHDLLEHGDIVGRDTAGRAIVQLAVDDWALERLLTFDADAAELEDGADAEGGPRCRGGWSAADRWARAAESGGA